MKKKIKWIGIGAAALISVITAVYYFTRPLSVKTVVLKPEEAEVYFIAQGTYGYEQTYAVYATVSGTIDETGLAEGERVTAGDELAVVSAVDYEFQIEQLEANAAAYQSQIKEVKSQEDQTLQSLVDSKASLEGELAALQAQKNNDSSARDLYNAQIEMQQAVVSNLENSAGIAAAEMENLNLLYQEGQCTLEDVNAGSEALNRINEELGSARQELESIKGNKSYMGSSYYNGMIDSVQAQIDGIDKRLNQNYSGAMVEYYSNLAKGVEAQISQLEYTAGLCSIISPVTGVLMAFTPDEMNVIAAGSPVAVVGIGEALEVYISQKEVSAVTVGDQVVITLEQSSEDLEFTGKVVLVDEKAEVQYSSLGVEESKVRVLIEPEEDMLGIGYQADVRFTTYRDEASLVVPKTAVFTDETGRDCLWRVEDKTLVLTPVELGVETRTGYQIVKGAAAGDAVVRDANTEGLADGKKAR